MFCMNCGTKLPDDAKFCFKCGTKIGTMNSFFDIKNNNGSAQVLTADDNVQSLSALLEDIENVAPEVQTLSNVPSVEEHLAKAKKILAAQEQEEDSASITDTQKEILFSKFKEIALDFDSQYKEIKLNYVKANEKINKQKNGCYAYVAGAISYLYRVYTQGIDGSLDYMAIHSFHASSRYNDIFTALSYSELSEMYFDASENSDDENSDDENAEEKYNHFLSCRKLSLSLFKRIALSSSNIEKAIALEYLARYYDENGDENRSDTLIKIALTTLKEIHSQKGKYTFIAAYHIAKIYDDFFDDEKKTNKWLDIAFSDYKFYKNEKDNPENEDCKRLSRYLFVKLCNDYTQTDNREIFKKFIREFREFYDWAGQSDAERINLGFKEAEVSFETCIKSYTGNFKYDLIKETKFDLGKETVFLSSTAATYTKLRAPFMRLANQKYTDFLKFYQLNVESLEDVFNKALPKAMNDLEDAFTMGIKLANKYGVNIERADLKEAVASYIASCRNENYKYINAIQIAVNQLIEEAGIKAREDADKDYSWVTTAGGFGVSGAIGSFILGSLVNIGTNAIANVGRFLLDDTAGQILRGKMNAIYHTYPQIGLWIANLIFDCHEFIFSHVTCECSGQDCMPADEHVVLNSNQKECQSDTAQYSWEGLLEHLIESAIAPQKLQEVINFLGYNSYFAVLYHNAVNDINIYEKNADDLDWYEVIEETLDELNLKAIPPLNLFSNEKKATSGKIFTADDLPEDFDDGRFRIPDGYTEIGESAFAFCSNLKEVIVPPSVNSVHDEAFSYCSNLLDVSFPRKKYHIGKDVFKGAPNVVVESQLHGSWENYYIEERPTYIDTTTIIEHRFSEFVLYGKNPYRLNHWKFYNKGTLSDNIYDIWGRKNILTIQELGEDETPITIPIDTIKKIKVTNCFFYITYVSQCEEIEKSIKHQPISQDYNKIKSLLQYIKHYNHDLISEAFKMLDIDYGGKPYEPDIEYALPDTDDSANDALTKSIDKDKANKYLERCQNKRKEIRNRIKGEDVVIATKQKQINFLICALNNALLRKEEILEYKIKEAFSTERYNKTMQLLQREYALNKKGILLGAPGAKIAIYIGIMHAKGLGVPISISNAKAWFDVAIQLGDENTKRIANDWKTSIKEAQLDSTSNSNHQNNEPLQGEEAFNTGKYADALPLLQKEYAKEGTRSGKAALYMGIMYAKGLGVSIDISMAKTLFAAAIKSGDADTKRIANDWNATINEPQSSSSSDHTTEYSDSLLGEEAFTSGKYTDALPLLQKDYAQGGTRGGKAALYIGIMCAKGLGVQVSIPNAKAWLKVALDLGDDDTKRIAKDWMSTL